MRDIDASNIERLTKEKGADYADVTVVMRTVIICVIRAFIYAFEGCGRILIL